MLKILMTPSKMLLKAGEFLSKSSQKSQKRWERKVCVFKPFLIMSFQFTRYFMLVAAISSQPLPPPYLGEEETVVVDDMLNEIITSRSSDGEDLMVGPVPLTSPDLGVILASDRITQQFRDESNKPFFPESTTDSGATSKAAPSFTSGKVTGAR